MSERRSILALPRYDQTGASSRVRMYQLAPRLAELGWDMSFAPLFDGGITASIGERRSVRNWAAVAGALTSRIATLLRTDRHDLLWIEKELVPYLPGILERALAPTNVPYAIDFDDAIFHNYDLSSRPWVRNALGDKLDRLLAGSALVTAGNAYLADYAACHGARNVAILPSAIAASAYEVRDFPDGEALRVGWIGSRTTTRYLADLLPTLAQAARSIPLSVVTIGAEPLQCEGLMIEQHRWSLEAEGAVLGSCHVGIMPLEDGPWERGKCAFKLIQYMAAGRPVIASAVGANCEVVTAQTGRLTTTPDDWVELLSQCHANPQRWRGMGLAGRERFKRHYSIEAVAPRLVKAFSDAIEGRS